MWWQVPNRTGTWRPTAWLGSRDSNYGICQDRNPFELRREFLPDLAKRKFKDVSSVSCALAALQLRQGFWQVVSSGRAELSSGLKCLTRAGRRTRTAEQAKKIIRAVASFRSTSALDRAMHVANAHRALRLAPLPLGLRGASAVAAQLARRAARARKTQCYVRCRSQRSQWD